MRMRMGPGSYGVTAIVVKGYLSEERNNHGVFCFLRDDLSGFTSVQVLVVMLHELIHGGNLGFESGKALQTSRESRNRAEGVEGH